MRYLDMLSIPTGELGAGHGVLNQGLSVSIGW